MKNIILIGMPGTGKSVVGQALARRLQYRFIDVDDLIVQAAGTDTLAAVLRGRGLEQFLALESQIGQTLDLQNAVIATGGSMVLSDAAMSHLKENGVAVWLETPFSQLSQRMPDDLTDRGIAAPAGTPLRQIYDERRPLYAQYADLIVASRDGEDDTARQVEEVMRTAGVHLDSAR